MKILMTSSSFPQHNADWKSIFIRPFIDNIARHPQIKMNYWGPFGNFSNQISYTCLPQEQKWLSNLMEQGGIIHLFRQGGLNRFSAPLKLLFLLRKAYKRQTAIELFHVNWLQNALPLWGTTQPAVISVLGSDLGLLDLPGVTFLLRQVFKQRKCVLAPNAEWMTKVLIEKFGDLAQVIFLPLGIDNDWYNLQRTWQNTPNKWLVVTRLTKKKIGNLFDWGNRFFCANLNHELHLLGPRQEDVEIPDWVHYHGPTNPLDLKSKWFPTATGLITLSQHDEGRPQVMLEAMAAGLPIIASKIPAHQDFIEHRRTGWLASSTENFNKGLDWLSTIENNNKVAENARRWVSAEIGSWSDCARRYFDVYKNLLRNK